MRNFKQLVWEDEGVPVEGETLLVVYRDPINGALIYNCAVYENGCWFRTDREDIYTQIEAWAYIPQCAYIYPYRRLGDE